MARSNHIAVFSSLVRCILTVFGVISFWSVVGSATQRPESHYRDRTAPVTKAARRPVSKSRRKSSPFRPLPYEVVSRVSMPLEKGRLSGHAYRVADMATKFLKIIRAWESRKGTTSQYEARKSLDRTVAAVLKHRKADRFKLEFIGHSVAPLAIRLTFYRHQKDDPKWVKLKTSHVVPITFARKAYIAGSPIPLRGKADLIELLPRVLNEYQHYFQLPAQK